MNSERRSTRRSATVRRMSRSACSGPRCSRPCTGSIVRSKDCAGSSPRACSQWSSRRRPCSSGVIGTKRRRRAYAGGAELAASSTVSSEEHAETIEFSDGSRVLLEPKASARVVRLDGPHTELALKRGKPAVSVRHREGASWTIVAGPYEVRVVGTKFTVDWQQASNAFRVAVTEGRVRVTRR